MPPCLKTNERLEWQVVVVIQLDWIVQSFTSPPTQYMEDCFYIQATASKNCYKIQHQIEEQLIQVQFLSTNEH